MINEKLLKQYSPIPLNYNVSEVMLYKTIAIDIWVRPLISENLTDELEYQFENNQLSDENQALLTTGGLLQYLAYAMCLEGLPFLWGKITEVGVVKSKSDNSESLSLKDLSYVQNHLRNQVEFLKTKVLNWLCDRKSLFPLFHNCQCKHCNCGNNDGLASPNPQFQIYGLEKRDLKIK